MRRSLGLVHLGLVLGLAACRPADEARPGAVVTLAMFHGDRARHGWNDREATLTPAAVQSSRFGIVWSSEPFDAVSIDGRSVAPLTFASPLYLDDVATGRGTLSVVFTATTNGFVYAVDAFTRGGVERGAIVWRVRVGTASTVPMLDGGLPLGVLSTPVIDVTTSPPRLYVCARDATLGWQLHALDVGTGHGIDGWPVTLDAASVEAVNRNRVTAAFEDAVLLSQRGALALSPDGTRVYIPFGAYQDHGVGWLVAVDATAHRVTASFSGGRATVMEANGGIWSAGGAAVSADGSVYVATGNGPVGEEDVAGNWGQSLLRFDRELRLTGTYTPFNHCAMDAADTDLGGSSPVLVPDDAGVDRWLALGGKQGSVHLLDALALPGALDRRPPCATDAASDASLLPPASQPQFGTRGPLNVFGPYSEVSGNRDHARMRSTPAWFRDRDGRTLLFATGSPKASVDSEVSVPPCLVRLRLDRSGAPAPYLAVDATAAASGVSCFNPGSPVVTGNAGDGAVVWVLDPNASRAALLTDPATPRPVLYAFDATTMRLLWRSSPGVLALTGKYATVAVAHGRVFVATDRLVAFGLSEP